MNLLVITVLLFKIVFLKSVISNSCTSFENVYGQFIDKQGLEFNQTINGCIERQKFNDKTIVTAYIRHQDITTIGKGSVRNVIHLSTISFWGCTTEEILPGAFRNVPELKAVQISYCNLKEIPQGVFNEIPQLETLRIHNNQIDVIENEAFANLTALKRIHADWNKLEYWNREWFSDSKALEVLDFQYNKIRTIPRKAFEAMPKLRQIFFDANEIHTIHADAFKGLKYLEYLGLGYNKLKEISEVVFPNKLKIRTLIISRNYLNFLSNEVLKKVSVKDIVMDYNPWKCSCLDRINYWISSTNASSRSSENCFDNSKFSTPVCVVPKVFSQSCLEYVDDEITERYLKIMRSFPKESLKVGCVEFK